MELQGQFLWGSNYTFLVQVTEDELSLLAVYKPAAGERPLWDFDHATLGQREVATYWLSVALGWPAVPPTVLRDGPHGHGSVQLFIDGEHEKHFFSLRDSGTYEEAFQQIVLFDYVINNADRKGGHCLLGDDGRIWSIDHGLTFHEDEKLRTVIWDYSGLPIPQQMFNSLKSLRDQLEPGSILVDHLKDLITPAELTATVRRLEHLLGTGTFPLPGLGRNVPYPLV
jgi:uncharacterized repeat protein (TIGR03843 family)